MTSGLRREGGITVKIQELCDATRRGEETDHMLPP